MLWYDMSDMSFPTSPYLYVSPNYQSVAKASGHTAFTLAFVTGYSNNEAVWDGGLAPDPAWCADPSKHITISFGGAGSNTNELAGMMKDATALADAYVHIAKTYHAAALDFDVEGGSVNDRAAIDRRNAALVLVQQKLPNIKVSYTLSVMPRGLDPTGVAILKSAKAHGVRVDCVCVMAMDYGCHTKDMGAAAIAATQATYAQLHTVGYESARVGIIPMIGVNDTVPETFTLKDAATVKAFASKSPWVGTLGFWSLNRDNGSRADPKPSDGHSGVVQTPFAFLRAFL